MSSPLNNIIRLGEAVFLRMVLDAVSDCLVVVDTDGLVTLINRPYCELLGGDPEDFIGRHIRDVVSTKSHLAAVAQGAPPLVGSRLVVRGREILTRQVPICLDGETIGALGVALFADSKVAESTLRLLTGESLTLSTEHSQWRAKYSVEEIVGRGAELDRMRAEIRQAARTRYPVVIQGETGVGKELVAQSIHRLSSRAGGPFVWLNCATIPPELVASELFGYEGGAFTGAHLRGGKGKIELAHGGTLFLDEIGDMPPIAQAAMLRFLQEGEVTRVGGVRPHLVDVRVVCASHKDLSALVRSGQFREDLLYRLRVIAIDVPPLRQRSDIDLLAAHLLARVRIELGLPRLSLGAAAIAQLRLFNWPGNVRELLATLQRAAAALPEGRFEIQQFSNLPDPDGRSPVLAAEDEPVPQTLQQVVDRAERAAVTRALNACRGNRSQAARQLGIDRASLYKRLREWEMVGS